MTFTSIGFVGFALIESCFWISKYLIISLIYRSIRLGLESNALLCFYLERITGLTFKVSIIAILGQTFICQPCKLLLKSIND